VQCNKNMTSVNAQKIIYQFVLVVLAFLLAAGIQTFAFTEPSSAPPTGDAYAPLNTGPATQDKRDSSGNTAWITADGLGSRYGGLFATLGGNVGIGTTEPTVKLEVNGAVRIGYTSLGCTSLTSGSIRYSQSETNTLQYCDGSSWQTLATAQCASVQNGTTGSYPECAITCNDGYSLQNGSCEIELVYAWGCGGSYGNNSAPCNTTAYTWGCDSSSYTSCGGNAYLFCPDGYHWTWTCGTEYSNGTRGQNVDESNCGGRHYSPWTCNP